MAERFVSDLSDQPAVRGFLHRPATAARAALVLTHGAGSNCSAPLLVAMADALGGAGITVLRCDLPFRQSRPHGPPFGDGSNDRAGLRCAVEALREIAPGPMFLGGHSYGGRQVSMLAAEDPNLAEGLLLLSYPLHPPGKPAQLRTAHFSKLHTHAVFVHGSRDPFGSLEEMQIALRLIPAAIELLAIEGAGHDLGRNHEAVVQRALAAVLKLV